MLINIIRYIKGYVAFRASGKFPERFLNITAKNGIGLWDAHPIGGGLEGKMSVADYRNIRATAKKARVTTKVLKKTGLPFVAARYRGRWGLAAGAAAGIALLVLLSNFVWTIDISGTETISDTRLMQALEQNGLKSGAFKGSLDVSKIKRDTLLSVEELGWMSINLMGGNASVEVREKAAKPEISPNENPCNIKAGCDGVITDYHVRSGTADIIKGSGVAKGDLLVSGVSLTKQNTVRYVHSDADVFADVNVTKELKMDKSIDYYSLTENKTERGQLSFFQFHLPYSFVFGAYDNTAYTQSDNSFTLNDVCLPIGTSVETAYELKEVQVKADDKKAAQVFHNLLALYEAFEKGDCRLVSRDVRVSSEKDSYVCSADYTFNENIAVSVDFSVEEE